MALSWFLHVEGREGLDIFQEMLRAAAQGGDTKMALEWVIPCYTNNHYRHLGWTYPFLLPTIAYNFPSCPDDPPDARNCLVLRPFGFGHALPHTDESGWVTGVMKGQQSKYVALISEILDVTWCNQSENRDFESHTTLTLITLAATNAGTKWKPYQNPTSFYRH